jgi:hypothetical protein
LTLPLAGLLVTWAAIAGSTFFDFRDAHVSPEEAAQAYNSLSYFLSQFVGYVLGLTLLTLGVFSLTVYLSDIRGEHWSLGAMVLSILGIGVLLSIYGLRTYAIPALGGAYLNGPTASVFYVAFVLYSAGFILFGFAVWGSGTLPRWSGVLLAVHAPLLSGPLPELFSILGALLLLVGGGWVALAVLRRPPIQGGVEAEPQARTRQGEAEAKPRAITRLRRTGT